MQSSRAQAGDMKQADVSWEEHISRAEQREPADTYCSNQPSPVKSNPDRAALTLGGPSVEATCDVFFSRHAANPPIIVLNWLFELTDVEM